MTVINRMDSVVDTEDVCLTKDCDWLSPLVSISLFEAFVCPPVDHNELVCKTRSTRMQ